MGSLAAETDQLGGHDVKTVLRFLLPEASETRRYVCPGSAVSTGQYGDYDVVVKDVRPMKQQYTLETKGFELARLPTNVEISPSKTAYD
jgi:hypothetical protein